MKRTLATAAMALGLMMASAPAFAWVDALIAVTWTVKAAFDGAMMYEQANGPILAEAEIVPNATDAHELALWPAEIAAELAPTDG